MELVEAGFGKMPTLTANGGKLVAVNSGATALEAITTTGTGDGVRATSPTLVTPALGTPASGVMTNVTGTAAGLTAGNVTTNANLTGGVTSVGNAATVVTNANLTGGVTSVGNAATVVTNANLTGHVTSVGNAAVLGSFTTAQLNAAVSDGDVATLQQIQTLTATLATITGTATAIIATQSPATANVKVIDFIVGTSNAGAATTIASNGDAAVSLKQYNSAGALVDPVLVANQVVTAKFDGTRYLVITPLPATAASIAPIQPGTAQNTTSGTAIDFTSIPTGVKRATVQLMGVSSSGGSDYLVQIGAGSVANTGYLGASSRVVGTVVTANYTTGFGINNGTQAANYVCNGQIVLTASGTNWIASGVFGGSDSATTTSTGGFKALGGVLDRIRLTTVNGTDTFDAGSVNISWEF